MIEIRVAEPDDYPSIVELGRIATNEAPAYDQHTFDPEHALESLERLDRLGWIQLAVAQDEPVGYMLLVVSPRLWHEGLDVVSAGMFIIPEFRGGTIFARMVEAAEAGARAAGADGIDIGTSSGVNFQAVAGVLERTGFPQVGTNHRKILR